jgi:hypothetical protein
MNFHNSDTTELVLTLRGIEKEKRSRETIISSISSTLFDDDKDKKENEKEENNLICHYMQSGPRYSTHKLVLC